jgi:hypothetical protein
MVLPYCYQCAPGAQPTILTIVNAYTNPACCLAQIRYRNLRLVPRRTELLGSRRDVADQSATNLRSEGVAVMSRKSAPASRAVSRASVSLLKQIPSGLDSTRVGQLR